jgi:hypothetical protein
MALTDRESQVIEYCEESDFLSLEQLREFRLALEAEGSAGALSFAIRDFVGSRCPQCSEAGRFKPHFLGRVVHRPGCGRSWHVSPLVHAGIQFKSCFHRGLEMGFGMAEDDEKKGKGGFLSTIFGFVFGLLLRLPFAILMIPIQTIVYFLQKKAPPRTGVA